MIAIAVRPLPEAGITLQSGRGADWAAVLGDFDASRNYLTTFVSPDSYSDLGVWRDALVEAGFEYKLVLMQDDDKVYVGTSATIIRAR